MIDLNKFKYTEEVILPVISEIAQYRSRKFTIPQFLLGVKPQWYKIKIFGTKSSVELIRIATPIEIISATDNIKKVNCFVLNSQSGILTNFNGPQLQSIKLNLNKFNTWDIVSLIKWYDGKYYPISPCYSFNIETFLKVKIAYDSDTPIKDIKNLTPELRFYWLILSLQKEQVKEIKKLELLAEEDRLRVIEEHKQAKTLLNILKGVVTNAGGDFISFRSQGRNIEVIWEIMGNRYNSLVRQTDLRVVESGVCTSGNDEKFSLSTIVPWVKDRLKLNEYFEVTRS